MYSEQSLVDSVLQGFMQDKIITCHTCFGGHMDVNCKLVYKLSNVSDDLKWATKHTYDTIYTHFQGITNNIYGCGRPIFARPYSFLPVQMTGGRVST